MGLNNILGSHYNTFLNSKDIFLMKMRCLHRENAKKLRDIQKRDKNKNK